MLRPDLCVKLQTLGLANLTNPVGVANTSIPDGSSGIVIQIPSTLGSTACICASFVEAVRRQIRFVLLAVLTRLLCSLGRYSVFISRCCTYPGLRRLRPAIRSTMIKQTPRTHKQSPSKLHASRRWCRCCCPDVRGCPQGLVFWRCDGQRAFNSTPLTGRSTPL